MVLVQKKPVPACSCAKNAATEHLIFTRKSNECTTWMGHSNGDDITWLASWKFPLYLAFWLSASGAATEEHLCRPLEYILSLRYLMCYVYGLVLGSRGRGSFLGPLYYLSSLAHVK